MTISILYVVLLLILFAGMAVWLRRFSGGMPSGEGIAVRGHRRLDAQHRLWIVEVDGRRLLVGGGREGVRLVQDLGLAEPLAGSDIPQAVPS